MIYAFFEMWLKMHWIVFVQKHLIFNILLERINSSQLEFLTDEETLFLKYSHHPFLSSQQQTKSRYRDKLTNPVWSRRTIKENNHLINLAGRGMKAPQANGAGWSGKQSNNTVNSQQAAGPANPQALNSLPQRRREVWGKGWHQREAGDTARAVSALWAKIMESSLGWRGWTHREIWKHNKPELIGFLYPIPRTRQACPQFQISLYWLTGLEK